MMHLNSNHNLVQRRGVALMLVMVAILVTGSMAVAYFGSRDNSIAISSNIEAAARARAVAESGLDLAVAILETDADWRTQHVDGVILDSFSFGGGEISVTIIDSETELPPNETTNKVEITILSSVGGITQKTIASATIIPNEEEFDVDYSEFALFTQSQITIKDISSVQQWAASPLGSQQNPIQIGTLATSPMSVQIDSWGQTSELQLHTLSSASSMLSTSISSEHNLPESPPFPTPPSPPTDAAPFDMEQSNNNSSHGGHWAQNLAGGYHNSFRRSDNSIEVQEGSYSIDSLQLGPNQPLVIHGNVTLTINNNLTLNATSIELSENATLTLHIGGDVTITSSYLGNENHSTNSWSDPSRIQMYGHNDTDWDLRGLTTIKGEIYAPKSDVELSGLTTLCGRIASEDITLRGASRVLYDQTLDNGGYADPTSPLHTDDGTLLTGVQQLTQLDPTLINSLQQATSVLVDGEHQSWQDWWSHPSERPNEVIYVLLVYGVDARRWESLARQMRWRTHHHGNTYASVFDQ